MSSPCPATATLLRGQTEHQLWVRGGPDRADLAWSGCRRYLAPTASSPGPGVRRMVRGKAQSRICSARSPGPPTAAVQATTAWCPTFSERKTCGRSWQGRGWAREWQGSRAGPTKVLEKKFQHMHRRRGGEGALTAASTRLALSLPSRRSQLPAQLAAGPVGRRPSTRSTSGRAARRWRPARNLTSSSPGRKEGHGPERGLLGSPALERVRRGPRSYSSSGPKWPVAPAVAAVKHGHLHPTKTAPCRRR